MKKGAAPDKGAPMPPPPGTAPGWQLRRFKTAVYIRLGAPCAPELGHPAYLRPMARLRTPERSPGRLASGACVRPSQRALNLQDDDSPFEPTGQRLSTPRRAKPTTSTLPRASRNGSPLSRARRGGAGPAGGT